MARGRNTTDEEWREYRRAAWAKYAASANGRAVLDHRNERDRTDPEVRARHARYRESDDFRAAQARYHASDKGKATRSAALIRLRHLYPEREPARKAVATAIRAGRLTRPPECPVCGRVVQIVAHHHRGYAPEHRLDIVWLCQKCHRAAHP